MFRSATGSGQYVSRNGAQLLELGKDDEFTEDLTEITRRNGAQLLELGKATAPPPSQRRGRYGRNGAQLLELGKGNDPLVGRRRHPVAMEPSF